MKQVHSFSKSTAQAVVLVDETITFAPIDPKPMSLENLVSDIEECETLDQVMGGFAQYPIEFGFQSATVIIVEDGDKNFLRKRVFTTLSKGRTENVVSSHQFKTHPIIEEISNGNQVFFFDNETFPHYSMASSEPVNGVAFMVKYASGLSAIILLKTFKPTSWVEQQFNSHKDIITGIASQFIDAFVYFESVGSKKTVALTDDELRFLRLLATSNDPEKAQNAHYTFGSAATLSRSISRKLCVKSLFQAVAIATKRKLLEKTEVCEDEITDLEINLHG